MNQRGSVVVYFMVSIALSIATGYGVYAVLRDQKTAAPPLRVVQPPVREVAPAPTPVAEPEAPEPEPPVVPQSVAAQRAIDPVVDEDGVTSPMMGVPGIDGPIERGSVDRRMRARSLALQSCWERHSDPRATVRLTMNVDADGRVTNASVSPGLSDPAHACIIAVLTSITFTSPGRPAEIVQPVAFR